MKDIFLIREHKDGGTNMKSQAIKGAKEDYRVAKKQVKKKFAHTKDTIAQAEKRAEEFVSDNPKKAVAIAAGIGAVVGVTTAALLMRKKKKTKEQDNE